MIAVMRGGNVIWSNFCLSYSWRNFHGIYVFQWIKLRGNATFLTRQWAMALVPHGAEEVEEEHGIKGMSRRKADDLNTGFVTVTS
jgi:hypothetical protein